MLFASKINADVCVAISAPTFLDPENRMKYNDERYGHEKRKLCRGNPELFRYLDLRSYFLSRDALDSRKRCMYCLFYSDSDKLDKIHARRMIGLEQPIHVFEVMDSDHNAARKMRDSGFLYRLCDRILSVEGRGNVDTLLRLLELEHSLRPSLSIHRH